MSRLIKQLTKLIPTMAVCTLLMCMLCFAAPEDANLSYKIIFV